MPAETQYLDSNVLLAYVLGEANRATTVEQLLREAEGGKRRLITSTISVVEVAFAAEKSKGFAIDPGALAAIDKLWEGGQPVGLAEASTRTMYVARDLARRARSESWGLTPADAIHLATAVRHEASVLYTYEAKATRERWSSIMGISVDEPTISQLPLL
ncbi:MAG: type II toxin-antitoxin system VapC family toxin [Actinomycetota bacterium]